ncbi:MAG: helix-turn-helix domain-containing protein [Mucilaginibacter sp.]|nr:helix-turn-helix domain-containing protein [Mucilaginibacter sp.]
MATQILTTTYDPAEFRTMLADCVSETLRLEIAKILSNQTAEKTIFTRQETAELLNISLPTLNEYTKSGTIAAYRLGSNVRYRIEDINKALTLIKTR